MERRDNPGVGGGFTNHGLDGVYYADANFGTVAFNRRDLRLDFDWGTTIKPGGSTSPGFRDVGTDNYSARWTGQLVPRFTEAYTFSGVADDGFKLELRPAGGTAWTTVVDQASAAASFSGSFALTAGQTYDSRVSYRELTGAAAVKLRWSSPSTPAEVIDPLDQSGMNNPDGTSFVDIVKAARNSWQPSGGVTPGVDADGWPTGNAEYVFQESLNQGLGLDPLMRGTLRFSFHGKATVGLFGNVDLASLSYSYDAASNTTTGTFRGRDNNINASLIRFTNTTRTGTAGGPGGFTDLKLLRPTTPDATTTYDPTTLFTTSMKDYARHYTVVRHQYVANHQKEWADRTRPTFFNQAGGSTTAATYQPAGSGWVSDNGWSWEYKVMFANETGTDLMLSLPTIASGRTPADTTSYLVKLANLIRYGSDGVEPYTAPTANPVYPPLNPNLRVYLELENELWNYASVFYQDYYNVDQSVKVLLQTNHPDFTGAINYDGLSTIPDSSGNYTNMGEWRYRWIMLRTAQASDTFRGVFGDTAMPGPGNPDSRIRPVYEWQYANLNDTARRALTWADRYFNKADPTSPYSGPARPVNTILWGGGGATYYGAVNGNGLTDLLANPAFAGPSGWTFTGNAGVTTAGTGDVPPAYSGTQVGYIAGTGRATATFTVPAAQTSDQYAVSFKTLNRRQSGASAADTQNLRVYLDYGTSNQIDLTARTFSQGNGYTPPDYAGIGNTWLARNVFWTNSQYYYTKSVALAPGSTHTVTVVGTATATQTAYLGEVRVTSVDAIFAGGIPGGGEATGQPTGSNIRNSMNTAASWAVAFGLKHLAYEGGWSLGGDDGGSYVQLKAKYGDPRTAQAQATFMDYYDQAGGDVNVFGTYAQIPSWADYYAEQGLLDSDRYPIVQGIDQWGNRLGASPTNGSPVPAVLGRTAITLSDRADAANARLTAGGGWLTWNVVVPRTGSYTVRATTTAGGSLALLADDGQLAAGASGGDLSGAVVLTRGLHTIKVRSTAAGTFDVSAVTVAAVGAPASPTIAGLTARNDAVSLSWGTVSGAAGYVVLYGTTPGQYTTRLDVGGATSRTVSGLANDTTYYFAVSAYGPDGAESLPSAPRSVVVLVEGQLGTLARWEFTGLVSGGATAPTTVAASGTAVGLTVGPLTRGTGLTPASGWMTQYNPDRFGSGSATNVWATTLAAAVTQNQYYQFVLTPAAGVRVGVDELRLQAWFSHLDANCRVNVRYSTDGTTFTDLAYTGSFNAAAGLSVPLAGVAALQQPTGPVTFRVYTYGPANYTATGIGLGTSADDLVVRGRVRSVPAVDSVTVNNGAAQRSMVSRLTVSFNTLVTLGATAFIVHPAGGGSAIPATWTTADVDGRTVATISFPGGSAPDGRWVLVTTASQVSHRTGGTPIMVADRVDAFFRLFGDGNGDTTVDFDDLNAFGGAFGTTAGNPEYRAEFDFNADGAVDFDDLNAFGGRFGVSV